MSRAGTAVRALLVADTHIGFDLPVRPRISRRRRGFDFLANFERALQPALDGEVDFVVHGGDLLHRSKLPPTVVEKALRPLVSVAEAGVPTLIVPGNHERSSIPNMLVTAHPNLHVYNSPATVLIDAGRATVEVSAFPFARRIAEEFSPLVRAASERSIGFGGAASSCSRGRADIRLLCMHQTVEGAVVGPSDYTFRRGRDIIPGRAIPDGFAAVLSGHIHRSQALTHDLAGRPLAAPVVYPGSVERTSIAERDEDKHFAVLELVGDGTTGGRLASLDFVQLPARPMVTIEVHPGTTDRVKLERDLRQRLATLPRDAVVRVRVVGDASDAQPDDHSPRTAQAAERPQSAIEAARSPGNAPSPIATDRESPQWPVLSLLSAKRLRDLAPPTMNIDLSVPRQATDRRGGRRRRT